MQCIILSSRLVFCQVILAIHLMMQPILSVINVYSNTTIYHRLSLEPQLDNHHWCSRQFPTYSPAIIEKPKEQPRCPLNLRSQEQRSREEIEPAQTNKYLFLPAPTAVIEAALLLVVRREAVEGALMFACLCICWRVFPSSRRTHDDDDDDGFYAAPKFRFFCLLFCCVYVSRGSGRGGGGGRSDSVIVMKKTLNLKRQSNLFRLFLSPSLFLSLPVVAYTFSSCGEQVGCDRCRIGQEAFGRRRHVGNKKNGNTFTRRLGRESNSNDCLYEETCNRGR